MDHSVQNRNRCDGNRHPPGALIAAGAADGGEQQDHSGKVDQDEALGTDVERLKAQGLRLKARF